MSISIVEVVQFRYPGQFEAGNVGFYANPNLPEGIGISFWNVDGEPEPTVESLVALFPQYETQYENTTVMNECQLLIAKKLDSVARAKQYSSAVACSSYLGSGNPQWAAEALAFIHWRDDVFVYAINIMTQVQQGSMPCPTVQEFMDGLPVITWPN